MIEHENINKNSALAMFRQMEAQNQQSKPPTYSSGMPAGQSYLKKPNPVPAKSILKKPKEQPEIVRVEPVQESVRHVPDIIRQGDTYNDLDDCKGVSVKNIKNMWGSNQPSQPQPVNSEPVKKELPPVDPPQPRESFAEFDNFENEIEKEPVDPKPTQTDPNDFDLLKNTPSVDFGDLKRMPEDGPVSEEGPNADELKPHYVENTQDRIKISTKIISRISGKKFHNLPIRVNWPFPCGQIVIQK